MFLRNFFIARSRIFFIFNENHSVCLNAPVMVFFMSYLLHSYFVPLCLKILPCCVQELREQIDTLQEKLKKWKRAVKIYAKRLKSNEGCCYTGIVFFFSENSFNEGS